MDCMKSETDLTPEERRSLIVLAFVSGVPLSVWALATADSAARRHGFEHLFLLLTALGGVLTAAFIAAYAYLTYHLWTNAAEQLRNQQRAAEASLMSSLMVEYDDLKNSIDYVGYWYERCASRPHRRV
jgi:hypothetical protein